MTEMSKEELEIELAAKNKQVDKLIAQAEKNVNDLRAIVAHMKVLLVEQASQTEGARDERRSG